MAKLDIRILSVEDGSAVGDLYLAAAAGGSGLARQPDEITASYVRAFLEKSAADGLSLGAFIDGDLVGEIHAARPGPIQFEHVLGDLTVAVHPEFQGQGIGTALFAAFFDHAERMEPGITRIELIARSGNAGALALYERLGFEREGCFRGRVVLSDGTVEDDIPMARRRL